MKKSSVHVTVYRTDYTAEVVILRHKNEEAYSFVNLTKGHICPCRFPSVEAALQELQQQVGSGKILAFRIE